MKIPLPGGVRGGFSNGERENDYVSLETVIGTYNGPGCRRMLS
jgi:hypothetical protein